MSEIEMMSIYITPFLIELVFESKTPHFNVITYKFECGEFLQLSEHLCLTYNFAVLVCFDQIIRMNAPMEKIVTFHRHDSYNHSRCIEHLCINQNVCGKFQHAYFNKDFIGLEIDLLYNLMLRLRRREICFPFQVT